MNRFFFEIAKLKILLTTESDIKIDGILDRFKCDETDFDIKCELIEDMTGFEKIISNGILVYHDDIVAFYEYENYIFRVFCFFGTHSFVKFKKENPTEFEIHVPPITDGNVLNLADHMCFDIACLHFNGFKLHSSLIKYGSNAILFSAPSQTGKSTQAELWRKYKGAEIVNGDKAYLRKIDGKWLAFGSPWAGTSRIWKNEFASNPAAVIIRQSPQNKIKELTPKEAVLLLLTQAQTLCWNRDDANRLCELIEDFVKSNPVFLLECRPDEEAVEIVHKFLLNKNENCDKI